MKTPDLPHTNSHSTAARTLALILSSILATGGPAGAQTSVQPCANCETQGPSAPPPCGQGDGENVFSAYSGNAHRAVTDMTVFGSVGKMPLKFMRYSNTRMSPQNASQGRFGREGVWTHNYQWFMRDAGTHTNGEPQIRIAYPNGQDSLFVRVAQPGVNGEIFWLPAADISERIVQTGSVFAVQKSSGEEYKFTRQTNASGGVFYRIATVEDEEGNLYTFTYNNANDTLLRQVTDPSGRFLKFTYLNLGQFAQQEVTLGTVPYSTSGAGAWIDIPVTNTTACRFLTLYYSNDHRNAPALPVGELEFYDTTNTKITTGTPFGSDPLHADPGTGGPSAAFDGDPATFYKYAYIRNGYVGIDLGVGNAKVVSKVRVFIPGSGVTAAFRLMGMNETASANWVIKEAQASDGRKVIYDYSIFNDPSGWFRWVTLDKATYPDGTAFDYEYAQTADFARPLLVQAVDPRISGNGTNIRYEFDPNTSIGFIRKERSGLTNEVIAETSAIGVHKPVAVYPNGRTVTYEYSNLNANLSKRTDGLGRVTTFTYDNGGAGHLASRKDAKGRITSYTNTALGSLLSATHPDGRVENWTRDSRERVLVHTVTGPGIAPRTTTWERDTNGRVTKLIHPDGLFEEWTYNPSGVLPYGQPLTHRLRNGAVETMTYSPTGLLTESRDAANQPTTYTYDPTGRLDKVTDARGHVTDYDLNDRGQVTKITWPGTGQGFVQFTYDAFGNRTGRTDEFGKTWVSDYDEFRRVESETDPLQRTVQYDYTGTGGCCGGGGVGRTPALVTLDSGKQIERTFDVEGQLLTETTGFGSAVAAATTYTYDLTGQIETIRLPGQTLVTTHTYDLADRLKSVTDQLARVTEYTYDAAGNRLTEKRPDLGVTVSTYDVLNRVLTTRDPKLQTVSFAYDDTARTVTLTDARGKNTVFQSDVRGQRTRKTYHDGSHEDSVYDEVGNLATYTTTAGKTLTVTSDERNRPTLRDWSDTTPDVTAGYDARGLLTTLVNSASTLTYAYDAAGQLQSETQDVNAPSVNLPAKTVSFTYDADGNRASLTYPGGTAVGYGYTARNQMNSVTVGGVPLAGFSQALDGKRTGRTLANGTATGYDYDVADQLKAVRHLMSTTNLQRFDYTLDAVGNRKSRAESAAGLQPALDAYDYDPADQLTEVKYAFDAGTSAHSRKVTYSYDPAGNRQSVVEDADGSAPGGPVTVPYVANDLNQYTTIDGLVAPQHDTSGNMTLVQYRLGEPGWTYQWDAQNRLIGGSNGLTTFAFAYDARNRCVARTIGGVTTVNLYDGWTLIEERSPGDTLLAATIHGPGTDEPLARITAPGTLGEVTVYYHQDGLGSTTALSDSGGNVVERVTYDVYGLPSFWDGAGAPIAASASGNRLLFTGREWLAELRLNDHRNRYYSPEIGRWLSRDPIEEAGGTNIYQFVANRPNALTDPDGLIAPAIFAAPAVADGVVAAAAAIAAWWAVKSSPKIEVRPIRRIDPPTAPTPRPTPTPRPVPNPAPNPSPKDTKDPVCNERRCQYLREYVRPLGVIQCIYDCGGKQGWITVDEGTPCPKNPSESQCEF